MFFFSISGQVGQTSFLLTGNVALVDVCSVGRVDLKLTSEKTIQLKNVQHDCIISAYLLCQDGYKTCV